MSDLREQASERLSRLEVRSANRPSRYVVVTVEDLHAILDALQPLFDQVERERAELRIMQNAARTIATHADRRVADATAHESAARVAIAALDSEREMNAILTQERDDLRAKLTQAEAHIDKLVDVAHGLADQQAMKDDSWIPDVRAAIVWRAALDRG